MENHVNRIPPTLENENGHREVTGKSWNVQNVLTFYDQSRHFTIFVLEFCPVFFNDIKKFSLSLESAFSDFFSGISQMP